MTQALVETGATLAFDATGGGPLAGQIFSCMEAALSRGAAEYSRYGSTTHKQLYLYGQLDARPVEFNRNFGTAWGIGGWQGPSRTSPLISQAVAGCVNAARHAGTPPVSSRSTA